jgi:hypothetical protein
MTKFEGKGRATRMLRRMNLATPRLQTVQRRERGWTSEKPASPAAGQLCCVVSAADASASASQVHYNIPPTLLNTSQSLFLPLSSAYSSILSLLHPNSFIEILFPAPASSEFNPLHRSVPAQFRINQRQQRSPCQYPPTLLRIS